MASENTDLMDDDVAAAVAQLRGAPAPVETADHETRVANIEQIVRDRDEPESAVDRLARIASDRIDGEPKEDKPSQQRADPKRDPGGRFAKKEAAPAETQEIAERIDEQIDRNQGRFKPKVDADGLPLALHKEERALIAGLPPEARKAVVDTILRREEETQRGFDQWRDRTGNYKEIDELIKPRREAWKKLGHQTDAAAIKHVFDISDAYERDPVNTGLHMFRHMHPQAQQQIMRALGIQAQQQGSAPNEHQLNEMVSIRSALEQVRQYSSNPNYAGLQHPEVKAVMARALEAGQVHDLETAHDLAVGHLVQQGKQLPIEVVGTVVARHELKQFEADPANEFYRVPAVRDAMQRLLENGSAKNLKEAYDQAMFQNPKLRSFSAKQAQLEKKQRASNASISGAPHGVPVSRRQGAPGSYDDTVEDVRAAVGQLR